MEGSCSITPPRPPAPYAPRLLELPQVELCRQLPGHGPQRQERGCDLGEEEGQEQAVHGRLQRQADDVAVRQQEEQEGELDQEGEEEEPGQLGHLWEQRSLVGWGDPLCPRASLHWPLLPSALRHQECRFCARAVPGCGQMLSSSALERHTHSTGAPQDGEWLPLVPYPQVLPCTCDSPSQAGLQEQGDRRSGPGPGDMQHSHRSPGRAVPHHALGT